MSPKAYTARSASDKTEDWPFWFVQDSREVNVTGRLVEALGLPHRPGAVLTGKIQAIAIASMANEKGISL